MMFEPESQRQEDASAEAALFEQVEVDTLLLADWAETINGKLYIQGGGWDRKVVKSGQNAEFAIAASIIVPWTLTNRQHEFSISVESEDGTRVAPSIGGTFTMGRPPNAFPGQRFPSPLAARVSVQLPQFGAYKVAMSINGVVAKSVTFYAVESL